jgi:uncharacterized membrane protein YkgB
MEETQIQPAQPEMQSQPAVEPQPVSQPNTEENFFKKNKTLIIGGIIALIVITVAVGILLSLKNSEKLEGLMKARNQTTEQSQVKIPRN